MAEHTPGPWRVRDTDTDGGIWIVSEATDDVVADILPHTVEGLGDSADANARLISAAPDLLLMATLVADEGCPDGGKCGECLGCFAIAAISKAKGVQP